MPPPPRNCLFTRTLYYCIRPAQITAHLSPSVLLVSSHLFHLFFFSHLDNSLFNHCLIARFITTVSPFLFPCRIAQALLALILLHLRISIFPFPPQVLEAFARPHPSAPAPPTSLFFLFSSLPLPLPLRLLLFIFLYASSYHLRFIYRSSPSAPCQSSEGQAERRASTARMQ